ncbi:MAG: hypothetical protein ACRDZ6_06590 [Acidimicrobiales bacterium]
MAEAIKVLEERSSQDPALAEAVVFLAEEAEGPTDPFGAVPPGAGSAARVVNARRERDRMEAGAVSALDTASVVALVSSIGDRKGVDRRRQRGQLMGWRSGARTLHPDWQFDTRRGETRPGLGAVLSALREVTPDAETADALMRVPRDDLHGRSLASLFAAGQVHTVVRLIRAAADQS